MARTTILIVVGVLVLFALPAVIFFGVVGWLLITAPAAAYTSLDIGMKVRRDGVVEVEETSTIDYGADAAEGPFRDLEPRFITDDGMVLISRLRFAEAFERLPGGRRRAMPAELTDNPGVSHYWSFGDESTEAAGRRTFVLRYEIHGGLREHAGLVEMPWNLTGGDLDTASVSSISATIEAPGLIDVRCAACEGAEVVDGVGRVTARDAETYWRHDVVSTLEAGSVTDPRPDLVPQGGIEASEGR